MQEHSPPVSFDPANWRWAGLHLALGIVAFLYPPILGLSLLAPALFFFLGWFKPDPIWFLFGLGYVLGAEVLWRMSMLPLPWELSKYLALIFAVGWLFRHPGPRKNSVWLGFCMLLPSCLLAPDLKSVRFAMLGLFVFTVWLWLLPSKSKAENLPFLKCLNVILLPLITMLGLSAMGILYALLHWQANLNAQELFIWFYRMKFASFGFGPNQVAWHYALGFLLCGLAYSRAKHPGQYFVLGLIFLFFCVATFSRGPFWVCILVAFWLGQGSLRSKALVLVLFGAFVSVVLGSGIWVRMTHFADSIRWKNAVAEIQIFLQHPLLGVGPGGGKALRQLASSAELSHVEFLRLLSEHGLLGLLVVGFCLFALVKRFPFPWPKTVWATWIWVVLYLSHSGTRTLAPMAALLFTPLFFGEQEESCPPEGPGSLAPIRPD